jgi:hypothetical protein
MVPPHPLLAGNPWFPCDPSFHVCPRAIPRINHVYFLAVCPRAIPRINHVYFLAVCPRAIPRINIVEYRMA